MTPYALEEMVRKVRAEVELASGKPHEQGMCNAAIIALLCTLVQHEADKEAERLCAIAGGE